MTTALDVICPHCSALPGERCGNRIKLAVDDDNTTFFPIWGFHDERHEAAKAAG